MGITRSRSVFPVVERPRCFNTQDQFRLWVGASRACPDNQKPACGICTDCTPEYKQEMLLENRCEHPETRFTKDNDGFLCGYWEKA